MAEQIKKTKVQQQIEDFKKTLDSLEDKQKELVSKYQMKEGDYKILIKVHQAADLVPKNVNYRIMDANKSACDAFVQITIGDQVKTTPVRQGTNQPIFQQQFHFSFNAVSVHDLNHNKIVFKVIDRNTIFSTFHSGIGIFQLDWTNVYFRRFHEIYRSWLTLSDPDEKIETPAGYLLVDIAVLGPQDKIQVHDSAYIKNPLTTIQDTVTNDKIPLIPFSLTIEVYRAENLIPLDLSARSVDAYVVAKFSGNKVKTQILTSLNPEWNQSLKIGTGVPNKTKYLILEVWNRNHFGSDDLIGAISIPFIDIYEDKFTNAQWGHLYGPPMCAKDKSPQNYASKMQIYGQQIGSHYRGRILYKVTGKKYIYTKTASTKIEFKFPFKPTPVIPLKTYTLSVELYEGFMLPRQRKEYYIQVAMGQYLIKTAKLPITEEGVFEGFMVLDDKKVQFPQDINQVPDIIIYFCDGLEQENRMCFFRIKAKDAETVERRKNPVIYEMNGDKSLGLLDKNQIGGCLTINTNLYKYAAPKKRIQAQYKQLISHNIFFYLYKGQGFPPANQEGDCDPYIRFTCKDKVVQSQTKRKSLNPFYQEIIQLKELNIQDIIVNGITKGIIVEAYDQEYDSQQEINEQKNKKDKKLKKDKNDQYIGSFLIQANNAEPKLRTNVWKDPNGKVAGNYSFIYEPPKWYYLINPHIQIGNNMFGKILLSYAIFKTDDLKRIDPKYFGKKIQKDSLIQNPNPISTSIDLIPKQQKTVQIYVIGVRNIRDKNKNIIMTGQIKVQIKISSINYQFPPGRLKKSGCQFNKMVQNKIAVPKNKRLLPFMDVKVLFDGKFYGFNSTNLYKILPKLAEKQMNKKNSVQDSQQTLFDVENYKLEIQLARQKKRRQKQPKEIQDEEIICPIQIGMDKIQIINQKQHDLDHKIKQQKNEIIVNYQYLENLRNLHKEYHPESVIPQNKNKNNNQSQINNKSKNGQINRQSQYAGHQSYQRLSLLNIKSNTNISNTNNPLFGLKEKYQKKDKQQITKREDGQSKPNITKTILQANQEQQKPLISKNKLQIQEEQNNELDQKQRKTLKKRAELLKSNQSEVAGAQLAKQMSERYTVDRKSIKQKLSESQQNNSNQTKQQNKINTNQINIQIQTDQSIKSNHYDQRAINYKHVQRVMVQEQKDQKQAIEIDKQYKFANAVKLSLFGWNRQKKKVNVQTYDDYDTDPTQILDITPEWYKGRHIHSTDFEDLHFKRASKIHTIPLYGGQKLQNSNFQVKDNNSAGHVKLIIMSENSQVSKSKEQNYTKLLKPKEYYCRIYILKGKSLLSGFDKKPSTYLRFTYGNQTTSYKEKTYVQNETNPEYYTFFECPMTLPGPCMVKIEVMEVSNTPIIGKLKADRVLGYTQIDLQQRHFIKVWHLYQKKPIQLRNLYSQYGMGSQGRLQTFIQLIEKKKWISTPPYKIEPPPFLPFQLRVIAWKTDDCVYKNVEMQSNDVYVRTSVGVHDFQQTDTHWCCRAVGNFNYRMKFKVNYPPKPEDMYSDVFNVQIWDRDLVGYNNLIGQSRINLNKMHRIIEKAVSRKKSIQAKKKIRQKGFMITDRFWFDVYNNKEKNEFGIPQSQGRVQLSFQLVPYQQSQKEKENGFGRNQPNNFPPLQQPEGRLQFDFFSPLAFIKQIVGPKLYAKWCCKLICCLLIILLGVFGYIFLPSLIAVSIAK